MNSGFKRVPIAPIAASVKKRLLQAAALILINAPPAPFRDRGGPMPRRVLLISCNRCQSPYPVFPLGVAQVAAATRRAGHAVHWIDLEAQSQSLPDLIAAFQPNVVGVSIRNIDDILIKSRERFFESPLQLCRELREITSAPLVLGGSGFSIFPETLLHLSGADYGLTGEGEQSFPELLAHLENGSTSFSIPGLVCRHPSQIQHTPNESAAPLNDLLWAERPPGLVQHYLRTSSMLNIQSQRGCAFRCEYCTYPLIEGRQYRRRDPGDFAAELESLVKIGARYVFLVDSVFNSSNDHVAAICEAILRRSVKVKWSCFLRPKNLTGELMELMARAGLTHIEFGTDSLCDSVLAAYGKSFSVADVHHSSQLAHQHGIHYCHFLICGGPGENRATLTESFQNSRHLPGAVFLAVVGMRVYPQTRLAASLAPPHSARRADELLAPHYFISPGWSAEDIFAELSRFTAQSDGWVIGDLPAELRDVSIKLRQRGVLGPLWSYFPVLQKFSSRDSLNSKTGTL